VAKKYFAAENRCVAHYYRKEGLAPEDPALAELDPQARAMVKQMSAQLAQVEDLGQLEMMREQMQSRAEKVPEEHAPLFRILVQKVDERIEALNSQQSSSDS
jgi:hypothetical protein